MAMPVAFQPRRPGRRKLAADGAPGVSNRRFASPPRKPRAQRGSPSPPAGRSPRAKGLTLGRRAIPTSFLKAVANVQTGAQTALLWALSCERARRWHEAIRYYQQLLNVIKKDNLPEEYLPGPSYSLLLFETYYHLGVAFQKLDDHHHAVEEYTKAIDVVQVPKYACQVGCASRSFLRTPVYARRAYAYVKCDKIKEAIADANRAVDLDRSNPDVYCIRALVWGAAKEKRRALMDLNNSWKLNPSHVCTLILRGATLISLGSITFEASKDHRKAFSLCQNSQRYFDVQDFNSPKMSSFFDTHLWSLNAFHTITCVNLFSGAKFLTKSFYSPYIDGNLPGDAGSRNKTKPPFRCGSLTLYPDETSLVRRKTYAELLKGVLD